jgi:hydroxyacylglutathione hydrolase
MLTVKTFVFNDFQENTYLLYDHTLACCVIDPGMNSESERMEFDDFILQHKLKPGEIINTHCHVDHVLGCKYLKSRYNIPFYIHMKEIDVLEKAQLYGNFFGLKVETPPSPDHYVEEGETFKIGESELKFFHVPGHSEGSIALYCATDRILITGDVLFRGSIGRTDLPGGDYTTLIKSIKTKLMTLPGNVDVYPGHGAKTTIENERNSNPFLI